MKYIKYKKVFESHSSIEDVRDICIELEHEGFTIEVSYRPNGEIRIEKLPRKWEEHPLEFKWDDVSDVVDRLKEYLGDKFDEMVIYNDYEDFVWSVKSPDISWYSLDIYLIIIKFNL